MKSHQTGSTTTLLSPWLPTSQFEGRCTLRVLGPQSISITVQKSIHHRDKWATGVILASTGAAVGLAAPWGGSLYHEATLTNLTNPIATLAQDIGDTLQNLWMSLNLLANVVFHN